MLLVALASVLLDQAAKGVVERSLALGESIDVIGGFFRLTHVQNPGGAFGLFRGAGAAFTALSTAAVVLLLAAAWRYPAAGRSRIAYGLVLGGALGNLIDRIRLERVVDFLDFGVGGLRWPVFNVADIAVVVGVGLFLLISLPKGDAHVREPRPEGGGESPPGP
ncbi:MAG: signal peptidase II [Candidatus Eisenbacteria bacterium]|nr:signal peptidase II [Candidatus Eisenbacteria bacterium]